MVVRGGAGARGKEAPAWPHALLFAQPEIRSRGFWRAKIPKDARDNRRAPFSAHRRGQELLPERCSLDELSDTWFSDQLAVVDEDRAAEQHDLR